MTRLLLRDLDCRDWLLIALLTPIVLSIAVAVAGICIFKKLRGD